MTHQHISRVHNEKQSEQVDRSSAIAQKKKLRALYHGKSVVADSREIDDRRVRCHESSTAKFKRRGETLLTEVINYCKTEWSLKIVWAKKGSEVLQTPDNYVDGAPAACADFFLSIWQECRSTDGPEFPCDACDVSTMQGGITTLRNTYQLTLGWSEIQLKVSSDKTAAAVAPDATREALAAPPKTTSLAIKIQIRSVASCEGQKYTTGNTMNHGKALCSWTKLLPDFQFVLD
ncbi:hypothetical protein DEU56DRAFT_754787 [Suillus clintonianus]|uniref:uncharacterized protein n=1 Tax=Suillus clintonianus TaxID=1904413 RepID=UPI001B884E8D|nr:uncharacterized protein DEU56DRAFT_754787 [Suillus clintonianus]KAG2142467.1 hypothetical protein DEU56DRAFT_754787 [Suillus clintonianus]